MTEATSLQPPEGAASFRLSLYSLAPVNHSVHSHVEMSSGAILGVLGAGEV